MLQRIMEYQFGAHHVDWQIVFVLLFLVFMFLAWAEQRSRTWKAVYGAVAAVTLALSVISLT